MRKLKTNNGYLPDKTPNYILPLRMDIANYLEVFNQPPPVMWSNKELLIDWVEDNELTWIALEHLNAEEAIRIRRDHGRWHYDNVWVRASASCYRKALKEHAKSYDLSDQDLETIDADHVMNRKRLIHHPEAWVMLFPVPWESNRPFGSKIERCLDVISPTATSIGMEPIVLLKVLSARLPKSQDEITAAVSDILAQIYPPNEKVRKYWADLFTSAIKQHFNDLVD